MHVWMRVLRNRTVSSTPRWEKVLYKKQPFSDNYTDERCFLDQLRTNVGLLRYSKRDAIRAGVIVMSQVDLVVLFLCCFESVQTNVLDELNLFRLVMCTSGVLVCCSLYIQHSLDGEIILVDWKSPSSWWEKIQTLLTILGFGYAFTPVIRTLTTSISTDTIYTSAILLFLASLFVHNYGMDAPIVSTAFSVNLCLTASVFLISRLQSDFQAFMLLGLSLCLFCFWPRIRCAILHHSPPFSLLLLFPLGIGSIACLNVLFDPMLAFAHFVLHFFIVILFPMLFVRMQKLKSTIHGPWDEATLRASIKTMDMEEENENPGVVQELPFTKFFAFYNSISEITDIGNKAAELISEVGDVDSCDRLDALLQRFANFDRELDKDRRAIDLSIQQANADNENSHPMLVNYFKSIRKDVQVPNPGLNQKHIEAIQKKVEEIRNEKLESANGNAANGAGEGEEPEMVELLGRVILEEKDPITKKRIEQPVKNSICGHIYDQQSVASFIEECRQRRQLCQCPVQMCKNRTQLKMQQMVPFPQFFDMIRRSTGPSTSG